MSCACHSLSSTTSSPPEESRPEHTVPGTIAGRAQSASSDLEDGEIADEGNVEETKAVDGMGEVVVKPKPSSDHDGRLEGERLSQPLGREHKGNSIPDAEVTLESSDDLEEYSGTDSSPHQLSTSSIPASDPTQDIPVANLPCARANNVSSVAIDSHMFPPVSEEELEMAKDVVLDLLGWGVQPEYLIECGVSSHAIYRIFTDLHLRLPSNLVYPGPG